MAHPIIGDQSSPLTVLLVDDDAEALDELVEVIEMEDWIALRASGIEQALIKLDQYSEIQVVVTDVNLVETSGQVSNGLKLVEQAHSRFGDRPISFVVLSGDPSFVSSSLQIGAVDFLTKPLDPDELVKAVKDAEAFKGRVRTPSEMSEFLMQKVTRTTASLKKVNSDLVARENEMFEAKQIADEREKLASSIRHALESGFILPWFQPQLDLRHNRICGFEALARWIEPDGTTRTPLEFLGMAKESGTLAELDCALRVMAMRTLRSFHENGLQEPMLGLNFTAMQLARPDIVEQLLSEVSEAGLEPRWIGIEVLETAMLDGADSARIFGNIKRLSELGFSIELDDFGTGHASLSSLRELAVNRVKIDRSFIDDVHKDESLQKFTRTLIMLAKSTGAEVLAEGVECKQDIAWLRSEGCDVVQGYYIAKAMPSEEALAWSYSFVKQKTEEVA